MSTAPLVHAVQKAQNETVRDFFKAAAAEADVTNLQKELKASPHAAHAANTDSTEEPHSHAALKREQFTPAPHAVISDLFWHFHFGIKKCIIQDQFFLWLSIPSPEWFVCILLRLVLASWHTDTLHSQQ